MLPATPVEFLATTLPPAVAEEASLPLLRFLPVESPPEPHDTSEVLTFVNREGIILVKSSPLLRLCLSDARKTRGGDSDGDRIGSGVLYPASKIRSASIS